MESGLLARETMQREMCCLTAFRSHGHLSPAHNDPAVFLPSDCDGDGSAPIPTVSHRGMICATLTMLILSSAILGRRRNRLENAAAS